jgi:hypothetical protein
MSAFMRSRMSVKSPRADVPARRRAGLSPGTLTTVVQERSSARSLTVVSSHTGLPG